MAINCPAGTVENETCWDCSSTNSSCTASLLNGTFTISGQGEMKNYGSYASDVPWIDKRNEITNVIVEDGITSLSTYTFYYAQNIINANIAPSVQFFGAGSFRGAVIENLITPTPNSIANFYFNPQIKNVYCLDENCESKFSTVAENIYNTIQKTKNGITYIYTTDGHLLGQYGQKNPPKRIYTIEEAARLSKPTGNTFKIRYK